MVHCPQWEFTDAEIFGIVLGALIAFNMVVILCLRWVGVGGRDEGLGG